MGAITWTRNKYTGIANKDERAEWYHDIGLENWFVITAANNGADSFMFDPIYSSGRAGYSLTLTWAGMNTTTANTGRYLNTITFNNPAGASAGTWRVGTGSGTWATPTNGEISFDTATIGEDIELLRICTTNLSWSHSMIFCKDNSAVTADGLSRPVYSVTSPYWAATASSEKPLAGTYGLFNLSNALIDWAGDTSNNIQYLSNAISTTEKYILRPVVTRGCISHIYSIDGSSNYAPEGDVEFAIGRDIYYSLGHGLCVKAQR